MSQDPIKLRLHLIDPLIPCHRPIDAAPDEQREGDEKKDNQAEE
jgi:hypothetical protein